jgi:radical S-adenosyl methionine domain-containing protein 2
MSTGPLIEAANWHITLRCNYSCRFCFMTDSAEAHSTATEVGLNRGGEVIRTLREMGVAKLNFVGGEPLLHSHLIGLAEVAKRRGMAVSIVTNGSLLTEDKVDELRPFVDWIGISIDSSRDDVEMNLGRGYGRHVENAIRVCGLIRKHGLKLKVNTVVTKLNYDEDMRPLIAELRPSRWKVFQMLVIEGQNEDQMPLLAPTEEEFNIFRRTNGDITLESGQRPTFETSDEMVDSYLMLAPDGSVIRNSQHRYSYVPLETVSHSGLSGVVDRRAYIARGGIYNW